MGTTKFASAPPLLIFVTVIVAFTGWVIYESRANTTQNKAGPPSPVPGGPIGAPADALLGAIHRGVPRLVIERHLISLPPAVVEPIDLSSGAPVLRSRYHILLHHPAPPHLMPGCAPHMFRPGLYLLILEFDGRVPGHPLMSAVLTPVGPN